MTALDTFYILASLFILANARSVILTPMDPIIAAGSDLNLTCTLDASTTYTSRDIIWTTSFGKDTDRIDPSQIDIISDSEAMLRLQNLTMANYKDQYHCYLPDSSSWHGTYVYVGMAPTKPTLNCFSTNTNDYWCEWSEIENTNLRDTYTFEYEYQSSWRTCPEPDREFRCNVPREDGSRIGHRVRVNVTNYLGSVSTEIYFDPSMAAIPLSPSIKKVKERKRYLEIKVELQPDITEKSSLRYQIRYCKNDTDDNWTEDSADNNRHCDQIKIGKLAPYTWYKIQARARFHNKSWSDWGPTYQAETGRNNNKNKCGHPSTPSYTIDGI
ncbi:cytokine receptor-like factor 1 [Antedon mediterranea]|uniref:cytokine receptor-like factor 1 n=1 Tax=Antedon mediterranea TaxID=105859 RepID=UPI003AF4A9AA